MKIKGGMGNTGGEEAGDNGINKVLTYQILKISDKANQTRKFKQTRTKS